ncbi:MAG TPA: arginine--tRNA ligase [Gammaproteobacteria bacterium]|nr:arginine--tRNA ligase [Gammaproteobacteria bacterium]
MTAVHDPRAVLGARLQAAVAKAFGAEHAGVDPMVRRSERADFQADLAMGMAKALKRAPRQVAEAVVAAADLADVCERVEIAGPGFINLTLKKTFIEQGLAELASDERLGVPAARVKDRVIIDYSAPNVAKEMHVGHLRSTIIGDALARLLEFAGHEVIRQNHIGDWGTPFGMLIEHLLDVGEAGSQASIGELGDFYRAARVKFDGDPKFADRARERVVLLQAGDARTLALWRQLVELSKQYFSSVYERLGVSLRNDDVQGESSYNAALADVAAELELKGLASINDGALCAFPPGFTNRDGEPLPLIVRKQDGGYGYGATDLAALRYRTQTLRGTRLLYVVGSPQAQHLAMVFAIGAQAGWLAPPARAEHVAFGSILGADKKMFKTRAGDTVLLTDLLDEAVERADAELAKREADRNAAERRALAAEIGIGAIKYADLANDRIKDYVFDWDRMLAAEGRTGPYLQYAHARIQSIFRKGAEAGVARMKGSAIAVGEQAERKLALELLDFGTAVVEAGETLRPHRLAGYLYDLATAFTGFFETCPVLKAPDDATRASRLALCELTARVLARGLGLLGIAAPERM